jgi:hypothetical protein
VAEALVVVLVADTVEAEVIQVVAVAVSAELLTFQVDLRTLEAARASQAEAAWREYDHTSFQDRPVEQSIARLL